MLKDNKYINNAEKMIRDIPNQYKEFKAFFKETYNKRIIYMYLIDALIITLIVEMLARHSFIKGIYYLISSPYVIICNAMIILMTLSITLLMRRRIFGMAIISIIWIVFGIANSVLLSYRVTPFGAVDLMLIDSALNIMNKYVKPPAYIAIILVAVLFIAGLVFIWIKIPKVNHKINIPRNIGAIAIICAIGMGAINLGIGSKLLATKFGNLADSYKQYGFVYCFVNSLVNTGVDKPKDYSDETIDNLANKEDDAEDVKASKTPNILFLQLESFFDVNYMKNLTYSENPLPTFTSFKEKYPSGFFNVPIVGAGTVNTEFEVMTGMNLDDFGPGEYPFKTILKETTCESICYNLKKYGYSCHAVHNNTATFYSRNVVFSNLGYDTFTSIENMHADEETTVGWAKDKYLTQTIMECLKSTKTPDYVYTISVQGHGSYPSDPVDYKIKVNGMEDIDRKYSFEYYVEQINEMDKFLLDLTNALSELDEETILVMYGDHLPSLGISENELVNENVYQTEYVIWSNFETSYEDEDIEAYHIQPKVLAGLNITAGDINYYSQQHRLDEDQEAYLSGLKNLEYDMLYGEKLLYDGENPYVATDIQYGLRKVKLTSINPMNDDEGTIYLYGKNFTTYSRVYVNDEKQSTEYVDESTLIIRYPELKEGDLFSVYQQNSDTHVLSRTEALVYEDENLGNMEAETAIPETTAEETTKKKKKKDKNKKS